MRWAVARRVSLQNNPSMQETLCDSKPNPFAVARTSVVLYTSDYYSATWRTLGRTMTQLRPRPKWA